MLHSRESERGAAVIVVLVLAAALFMMGTMMLSTSLTDRTIAANEAESSAAFNVAEAGIEHAVAQLHDTDVDTLLAAGGALFTDQPLGNGMYSVKVTNNVGPDFPTPAVAADGGGATDDTDGLLVVTSTGRFSGASRTIEVIVDKNVGSGGSSWPYQFAAFGLSKVKASNSEIYGPAGSNGSITFSGAAPKVYGDAQAVGTISAGYVTGTATEGAPPVAMPPVACPAIPWGPAPTGSGVSFDPSSGKLSIGGPAQFDSGTYYFYEFKKSGGDPITVPAGANVQIYVSNKMAMSGGGFTNLNGAAETLQVWGCGTGTGGMTITGPQTVWMTVYAPNQKVKFTGEGDKHGSFVGLEWENSGPGDVYFDNQLASAGGGSPDVSAVRGSWRELF